jgi:hypothetical protein
MRTRPGFARLLPLAVLTGLAAGTIALLSSARPTQAPAHPLRHLNLARVSRHDGGCSAVRQAIWLAVGLVVMMYGASGWFRLLRRRR